MSVKFTYVPKEDKNIEILVDAHCYVDPRNIELINEYKITEIIENKDKNNQSKFTLTCVNKKKTFKHSNENKSDECASSSFQVVLSTSDLEFRNENPKKPEKSDFYEFKLSIRRFHHFLLDRDLSTMKSLSHKEMYKFLAEGTITKEGTVTEEGLITEAGFITKGERETTFNRDDYFNKSQQGSGRKMRKRSQSRKKKRKSRAKNIRKKSKRRRG